MWDLSTRLSLRRVRVLLDRLPPESATHTAMRDVFSDEELRDHAKAHTPKSGHGPLSRSDIFLIDLRDQLAWVEYAIYRSQGGKPRQPEPTPRPGVVTKASKKKTDQVAPLNAAGLAHLQHLRETGRR